MKHHSSRLGRKEGIAGLLLVTPQIIYFLVFFLLPLGICVYAGFTNWNILSPLRKFVGLRNFDKLFSDPKFWTACKNTLYYLIPIPFYLTFALAFAYSCHKRILGEKVFRVLYYLPFISSIVALTLIWKWLFNAKYGLVNLFLGLFGIAGPDWLGDPVWTRRMIVIMISWKMIGIISIYYIAALKNVPSTYYEAAKIDGASSWQQFKRITLPLLTPTTFYLIVTGMIGSLQTFLEVNLFAPDGGRGYGVGSIVFLYLAKAFDSSQMGYACACATVFGVAMIILTAVQFTVSRKWVYEGNEIMEKRKTSPKRVIAFVILGIGACTMVLPFLWMLSTSLKDANLVYAIPPQWIPNPVDWENYRDIWSAANLLTGIKNSLIVTVLVLLFSTLTSSMAAFAFAKLKFPAKRIIFLMLLSTMMVPAAVLFVPQYIVYTKLHWIDTLLPLIIPASLCNISNTFFLRQFMTGLPSAYLDAAKIDGCSYFGAYWRIFLPLCKPAIITNAIMLFMATWNDYMNPMIFIHSDKRQTIQVAIAMMSSHYEQQTDIPLVMAASLIALLPVLILFITCQKYFVDSVAITGVKG